MLSDTFLNHLNYLRNELADSIDLVPIIIGSERLDQMCGKYDAIYSNFANLL